MTTWFVHRREDGTIQSAYAAVNGLSPMPDYAPEGLDDATNAEIQAYRTKFETAKVDAIRDARFAAGYIDATTLKTYSCDPTSLPRWAAIGAAAGLALMAHQTPTFDIITADNSIITLSAADAFALLQGRVMPWFSATAIFARRMKDSIIAGESPADINSGWP